VRLFLGVCWPVVEVWQNGWITKKQRLPMAIGNGGWPYRGYCRCIPKIGSNECT